MWIITGIILAIAGAITADYIYRYVNAIQSASGEHLQESQQRIDDLEHQLLDLSSQYKQAKAEAEHNQVLYGFVTNLAFDAVFVLDINNTIISANKSAERVFNGVSPVGKTLQEVLHTPELEDLVQRALNEEESLEEQFVVDGHYYRARIQVSHETDAAQFIGIVLQDVSQLVRLNRARRDMVANISHELGTPIANIRLIIDGLFHDQDKPKRRESIASLHAIARETESLQWTVQELLDLSMIESGQALMKLVEQPLHEIVTEAIERLDEKLAKRDLIVIEHVPHDLRILCDREHIRRVLINLISNAIKWSPKHQKITINATSTSDEVTIRVFDNGPGVPDDQCERIFERFYQVDTARSGAAGSGLGLAICKHIVEAHGGRIWAEGNSQGSGGRFLFTLLNADADETGVDPMIGRTSPEMTFNGVQNSES